MKQQVSVLKTIKANRRGYIIMLLACAVFASLLSLCVPNEYAAEVSIADERKESDILLGLTHAAGWYKQNLAEEDAMYEIPVYIQLFESEEFIDKISRIHIPSCGKSYYEYVLNDRKRPFWDNIHHHLNRTLDDEYDEHDYVISEIMSHVRTHFYSRKNSLTIQVVDTDPVVSAQMADSIRVLLHARLLEKKIAKAGADLERTANNLRQTKETYEDAKTEYKEYADSHLSLVEGSEDDVRLSHLKLEMSRTYEDYSDAIIMYERAKALSSKNSMAFSTLEQASVPLDPVRPSWFLYFIAFAFWGIILLTWYYLFRAKTDRSFSSSFIADSQFFSPWMLTTMVWAGILFLFLLQGDLLYPLGPQFYTSICLWLPIFLISSLVTYYVLPNKLPSGQSHVTDVRINDWVFDVFFYISVIITPMYVYQILKIVMMFDTQDLLYNIRVLAVHGDEKFGFLNYSYIINQALFIVGLWKFKQIARWKFITIVITNLMGQFALMEKSGIFLMIIATLFVLFERGVIKVRSIVITVCSLVLIFFLFNMAKEIQSDENAESMTFLDFFAIYVLSPCVAYERVVEDLSFQFGSHTFQYFYLILNKFGCNFEVNDRIQDFVWVPLPTNVYTIFQPFYEDFGQAGIAYFAALYGILSGVIYRVFTNGSFVGRCVYADIVKILMLQFYSEDFLQNFVLFAQFVIIVFIISQTTFKLKINKDEKTAGLCTDVDI